MVIFCRRVSWRVCPRLIAGGYAPDIRLRPIVYKATWPDEKFVRTTVADLAEGRCARGALPRPRSSRGRVISAPSTSGSKLYDPTFTTEFS